VSFLVDPVITIGYIEVVCSQDLSVLSHRGCIPVLVPVGGVVLFRRRVRV
jgi:hypothetical protein